VPELDYLLIGHVVVDRISRNQVRVGGTAAYSGLTARNLGMRVGVLTSAAYEPALVDTLEGIRVARVPAEFTTQFVNSYDLLRRRTQRIEWVAEPLEFRHLLPEWQDAPIVHLAPLVQEVDPDLVTRFPNALIGVTPQGWLRAWDEQGVVHATRWEGADAVLERADAIILSAEDIADPKEMAALQERARLLVVTEGRTGATLYRRGERLHHSPAFRAAREYDPTGAGDVFAAAFLVHLQRSGDPLAAADMANCVASFAVERAGLHGVPTLEQVEARWKSGKRIR
jgi:hypothetical protein